MSGKIVMTDEQKAVTAMAAKLGRLFYQCREDSWDDDTLEAVAVDEAQQIVSSLRPSKT